MSDPQTVDRTRRHRPAFPPGLAAGGALLGWAGIYATKGRRLSQAAFVIGVLGVLFNVEAYAEAVI